MSLWWAVAFQRLLVLGLGLLAGCDATRTERLAIDIGGDGATIAAYREVEQGHASDTRRAFRVVRALGDRRRGDTLDLGVGSGRMWPTSFDVFVDPDGRFYFAAGTETATHLLTATSVDAVWSPVEIDPTIPVGPRAALAAPELFGHAWMDGGSLRLLVGRWDDAWLLRCAGGRVVEALPMDHGCSPIESIYGGPQCYVAVTDTGRVDALVDGWPSTATTSTLECSDVTCRWAPTTGVGLPAVDRFPDIRWEHRLLLHSSADELAFLNHLGFPHEVSVLGDDTEIRLESDFVGGASRPGGGLLVHRLVAGEVNELLAIRGGVIERAYPLGASDMGHELGSVRTTVVVHHDSSGRAVAIVGAMEGSGSARLITVDLEDGSTTERTLDF